MTQEHITKKADTRDCIRVVTSNEFLKIEGLNNLSLKAIKLLYIVIAQCEMDDEDFYQISIKPTELQKLWGIKKQSVYRDLKKVSKELVKLFVSIENDDEEEFEHIPLFAKSTYKKDSVSKERHYIGKINNESNFLFLKLQENYSQPLLIDFSQMKTVNSILLWHLIQIKAKNKSRKPTGLKKIKSKVTVEEIRKVTGTLEKYPKIQDLRRYLVDAAIKDIEKNCGIKIDYNLVKQGRKVVGFEFIMTNKYAISREKLSPKGEKMLKRAESFNNKVLLE
jgi:plasmid replication initiation protein